MFVLLGFAAVYGIIFALKFGLDTLTGERALKRANKKVQDDFNAAYEKTRKAV